MFLKTLQWAVAMNKRNRAEEQRLKETSIGIVEIQ